MTTLESDAMAIIAELGAGQMPTYGQLAARVVALTEENTRLREPRDPIELLHLVSGAVQNGLYGHGGVDPGTAACYSAAAAVIEALEP